MDEDKGVTIIGVPPGSAATIRVAAGQLVVVARVERVDEEAPRLEGILSPVAALNPGPGRFILVPIGMWERVVRTVMTLADEPAAVLPPIEKPGRLQN